MTGMKRLHINRINWVLMTDHMAQPTELSIASISGE